MKQLNTAAKYFTENVGYVESAYFTYKHDGAYIICPHEIDYNKESFYYKRSSEDYPNENI